MVNIYRWDAGSRDGQWLSPEQFARLGQEARAGKDVWWVDLEAADEAEERLVFDQFLHVHLLTLEDITKPRREPASLPHFPKVEEFPDYLFVVVNPLDKLPSDGPADQDVRPRTQQLSAVLTHNVLITHHYEPLASVKALREFLGKHCQQVDRGPDYLFHIILDAMVDEYAPTLDLVTDRLDALEDEVFGKPTPQLLVHLLRLKRDVVALRKTLILEREVLARLTRGEFALIDAREIAYYRNVYDHLVRYAELVETSREMVSDLMQTHLAALSNKMNAIMKTLTMISTVILPMSLIAGVYGMNFKGWFPELEWRYGYPFALGLMALVGAGAFVLFRWRKWL